MGGEYLPALSQKEVMIASITIASTTQDVTSVYARRGKKRICYASSMSMEAKRSLDATPAPQLSRSPWGSWKSSLTAPGRSSMSSR